jgi:hypothetical protein
MYYRSGIMGKCGCGSDDRMTWFVVADEYCGDPSPEELVWTVSKNPKITGWNTDSGYPGYGLTKADAEELAFAANLIANSPIGDRHA